ncbi:MAG: DUF2695 domain-containing protein [Planctomycetota bacterium]
MSDVVEKFLYETWGPDEDWTHWYEFEKRYEDVEECDHTLNNSKKILKDMGYSDTEIEVMCAWFREKGGYCDCEVYLNVFILGHGRM